MSQLKAMILRHPIKHLLILVLLFFIALFHLLKTNKPAMNFLITHITTPIKQGISYFCSFTQYSVGEILLIVFLLFLILACICWCFRFRKKKEKKSAVYLFVLNGLLILLSVYTAFSYLWGINYYGDSLQEKLGIYARPISVEELYQTTYYFAQQLNFWGGQVKRDEDGLFAESQDDVFEKSEKIYKEVEKVFPQLKGAERKVKKVRLSKVMSYGNCTGFYFPFTAEANVNIHSPFCMVPATIAHEIAHQRNVASEQEANFAAVLACSYSREPAYLYSGYLMGYTYLSNALYQADYDKWLEVALTIQEDVNQDIRYNSEYWDQFETPVSEISDRAYDSFLKSYDQDLGMQSYGAVVDLLVAYFGPMA